MEGLKNGTLWQFPNLFRYRQIPSQWSRREIYRRAKHKSYANKNTSQNSQRYQNFVVSVVAVCQIWLNEYFHQGFWLILPSFTFTDQVFPGGTDRRERLIRILNPRLEWEEVVNSGSTVGSKLFYSLLNFFWAQGNDELAWKISTIWSEIASNVIGKYFREFWQNTKLRVLGWFLPFLHLNTPQIVYSST